MASNSRPSSSICWSLSRASGLSIMLGIRTPSVSVSQGDLDGALGGVDAGAHDLADAARDLAGAQVADLAGAQRPDARVADPHPAAVGQRRAGLLAGDQDRLSAVTGGLDVADGEADGAALAELAVALADDGLKALEVQAVAVSLALPVLGHGVEHLGGAREEGLALAPVRALVVEPVGADAAIGAGHLLVQAKAGAPARHRAQLLAEDHVAGCARGVQVDDVAQRVAAVEVAQHAHDGGDAAAGAEEEQAVGQRVGQREGALHVAEAHDRPGLRLAHEPGRDDALLDELGGDADEPVGAAGVRGQRVGAPVVHAVDHEADAQILAGLVAGPLPAGLDEDRHRVVGLALHALDASPELLGRPQRVDELEVVVGQQRCEQRAHRAQRTALQRRDSGSGAALSHQLSRRRRARGWDRSVDENECQTYVLSGPAKGVAWGAAWSRSPPRCDARASATWSAPRGPCSTSAACRTPRSRRSPAPSGSRVASSTASSPPRRSSTSSP